MKRKHWTTRARIKYLERRLHLVEDVVHRLEMAEMGRRKR